MKIPASGRKKALLLVDIQRWFVDESVDASLTAIKKLIAEVPYDVYASCSFYAEEKSLWDLQTRRSFPKKSENFENIINEFLKDKNPFLFEKTAKSAFKGEQNLHTYLQEHSIEEVHIVGYDIYDCVFATAQEAFDLNYFTYVIEECCDTVNGALYRDSILNVMKELALTNNSMEETIPTIEVNL